MSPKPCDERELQLEALVFGELEGTEKAELEAHLEGCPGCLEAIEDVRAALDALRDIADPPLPYEAPADDSSRADRAWTAFQHRLQPQTGPRTHRVYELLAMAALLLIGIGLGRIGFRSEAVDTGAAAAENLEIAPEAIAALERAELLSDIGIRYVDGLNRLLVDVMDISVDAVSTDDLLLTRERARELLEDGRLLERALDAEEDRAFLRAIRRAELFLEELAAVESSGSGTGVRVFQASLRDSRLPDELAALDLERQVSLAIEASGWIGQEDITTGKDF